MGAPFNHSNLFNPVVDNPCFIIAEAGVNHNGSEALAYQLIDAALKSGADAVKFQLFDPKILATAAAPQAVYQQQNSKNTSQQAMLETFVLPQESYLALKVYAESRGVLLLCSPFDIDAARFLVTQCQLPFLKIASGELTNKPFLEQLAELNVPLILSTGMANLQEVKDATNWLPNKLPVSILHCVSAYPAPVEATNLRAIKTLREKFPHCVIGFSDHSDGIHLAIAAVAMGAKIIEKHLTLDKTMPGPDHAASLTPDEFKNMVDEIRHVEEAMGDGIKSPHLVEKDCATVARKSLVTAKNLPKGHVITQADILIKRPGTGLPPAILDKIIGKALTHHIDVDTVLKWEDLEN